MRCWAIETLVPDFKTHRCAGRLSVKYRARDAASDDAASERASGEEQRSPTKRWRAGISGLAAAALAAAIAWVVFQPAPGEFGANEILNSDWLFTVDESAAHQTPLEQKQPSAPLSHGHGDRDSPHGLAAYYGLLGTQRWRRLSVA